jgi:iron-sulfur cluster assembly protein
MFHITPAAVSEMRRLLTAQGHLGCGLRVGVKGGACSGLSYTLQMETKVNEHDRVFEVEGIRIICDPKSYLYLNDLTLDYHEELVGGGFKFLNPKRSHACACGH